MVPALDELEIRYARSGLLTPNERQIVLAFVAVNHRAWHELDAVLAPDLHVVDHRRIGFPAAVGSDPLVHALQDLVEQVPDLVVVIERIESAGRAILAVNHQVGTSADGVVVDWQWYLVFAFDDDGRIALMEYFDCDNDEAQGTRTSALRGARRPRRVTRPTPADGVRGSRRAGTRDEVRPVGRRAAARLPAVGRGSAAADRPAARSPTSRSPGSTSYTAGCDEYIGRYMTCVQFDKRGIGLSDRPDELPTLEQRIGDIVTVMDARRLGTGAPARPVRGRRHEPALRGGVIPERVDLVVLIDTVVPLRYLGSDSATGCEPGDPPLRPTSTRRSRASGCSSTAGRRTPTTSSMVHAEPAGRPESSRRWFGRLQRLSASPGLRPSGRERASTLDAGDAPERITAPTLVMHVNGDRVLPVAGGRLLAELVPGARYVEITGDDHFPWLSRTGARWPTSASSSVTGIDPRRRSTTRRFATVLFTDIVDSTQAVGSPSVTPRGARCSTSTTGLARKIVDQHGGRVVKSTGDGLLAVFDVPSQGVECGSTLCRELAAIDVPIRAGVHAGEIEVHDDGDISGIAVNLAARVEQAAADGELWVSSTVRDMMLGGAAGFDERGEHELKGIDGSWKLFAVR